MGSSTVQGTQNYCPNVCGLSPSSGGLQGQTTARDQADRATREERERGVGIGAAGLWGRQDTSGSCKRGAMGIGALG